MDLRTVLFLIGGVGILYLIFYVICHNIKNKKKIRMVKEFSEMAAQMPDDDGTVGPVTIKSVAPTNEQHEQVQSSPKLADEPPVVQQTWKQHYQFNILARENKPFSLQLLRSVFAKSGLEFGKYNILYKNEVIGEKKQEIFRVANLLKPGDFPVQVDPNSHDSTNDNWSTKGICIIMFTPKTKTAENKFVNTYKTIETMNMELDGLLCTDRLEPMTDEVVKQYRSELQQHDHS